MQKYSLKCPDCGNAQIELIESANICSAVLINPKTGKVEIGDELDHWKQDGADPEYRCAECGHYHWDWDHFIHTEEVQESEATPQPSE